MSKLVYIIAGEASGDFIGAQLIRALKLEDFNIKICGIGGSLMQQKGLESLFPMEELSLMGVAEILPKIPQLLERIDQTVDDIIEKKPDVVVTIDAPDFSFRVQKKVRKKMSKRPKQVHYVAPTVWAWREKRAEKVSKFLDAMICLFDFEPPYFEEVGLKAVSVGHPMVESGIMSAQPALIGDDNKKKLGVFLGSRQGELKRTAPVIIEALKDIAAHNKDVELIIPTLPHLEETVQNILGDLDIPMTVTSNQDEKWPVFKTCDAAIAVSGTVGLELAVADVPHIIAYRASPVTVFIVRRLIKTPFVHLANIILGELVVPELLQEECTPQKIAMKTKTILSSRTTRELQQLKFRKVRERIGVNTKPSERAAEFLLSL